MHRITFIVTFASLLLLQSASRAQDGPVLNPYEVLGLEPEPTEFACVEHWDLPSPIGLIDWRDFPPEGLIEVLPQTKAGTDWVTGMPLADGVFAGPHSYTYDEDGRISTWTSAYGDFENPLEDQIQTSYAYDESGNLVEVVRKFWRDGRWLTDSRSSYFYLDEGPVSHLEFSVWDSAAWDVRGIVECQYDDAGRLTRRVGGRDSTAFVYDNLGRISEANRSTQVFRSVWSVRTRFEYDDAGRLMEAINPRNDPSVDRERFVYHYDSAGRLSAQETHRDYTRRRVRHVYQHRGLLTRTADDVWTVVTDGWLEQGETRHEYDADGLLEMTIRYPGDSESWSQSQYRYDDRNRIVGETHSNWTGVRWDQQLEVTYEYDAAGLLLSYTELWDSNQRGGEFRLVFSYAVGTANSEDLPAETLVRLKQNYPNPASARTTIEYTLDRTSAVRLTVFDALGRSVTSLDAGQQPPGQRSLDLNVSDLPPGVYLYRLDVSGAIRTGSMVVAD